MLDFSDSSEQDDLELWIRSALTLGELSPGIALRIQHLSQTNRLSARDRTLLDILRDAIQDGCIRKS